MGIEDTLALLDEVSKRKGIDPKYLRALGKIESGYNPNAVSPAGAQGLLQLMPATARQLGVKNSFDPAQNAEGGGQYFLEQLQRFKIPALAAAAYNSGPGRVLKYGSDLSKYPLETQNYVKKFNELTGDGTKMDFSQNGQQFQNQSSGGNNLLQLLSQLQQNQTPQAQIDPSQLLLQQQPEEKDKFNKIIGALSTIGGNVANIIGGIKGNPGAGNAAIESGAGLLAQSQKRKQEQQKISQINALLSNPALPQNLRVSLGLTAQGVPANVVQSLLDKPDTLGQLKDLVQLQQAQQNLQTSSPEYKQQSELNDEARQKRLLDYRDSLATRNEGKKSVELKQVPAVQAERLADGKSAIKMLSDLDSKLGEFSGGPVTGFLGSHNPYDKNSQKVQAQINATKQVIGKFLEGGVLRKEDEEKYEKILPTIRDLPEIRKQKVQIVKQLLNDRYQQYLSSFKDAGFDTSNFQKSFDESLKDKNLPNSSAQTTSENPAEPSNQASKLQRYNELLKKRQQ